MLERLLGYILYYNFGRPNEGLLVNAREEPPGESP